MSCAVAGAHAAEIACTFRCGVVRSLCVSGVAVSGGRGSVAWFGLTLEAGFNPRTACGAVSLSLPERGRRSAGSSRRVSDGSVIPRMRFPRAG